MEDMAMVLDMLVLDMLVLDMLDLDMLPLPMDTPPLDTMARDLLMLSPRLRLMLVFTMVDMDLVLAMLVTDMDIPLMVLDTVDTTMVRSISKYVDEAKAQSNHRLAHCYSVPSFEV